MLIIPKKEVSTGTSTKEASQKIPKKVKVKVKENLMVTDNVGNNWSIPAGEEMLIHSNMTSGPIASVSPERNISPEELEEAPSGKMDPFDYPNLESTFTGANLDQVVDQLHNFNFSDSGVSPVINNENVVQGFVYPEDSEFQGYPIVNMESEDIGFPILRV